MLPRYRIVDRPSFFSAIRRTLRCVLSLTLGMTLLVCYFFASTAFTRNKDGKYCDYYNEGLIYYAADNCYVEIMALINMFSMFLIPSLIFFFVMFSMAGLGMFLLYLRYQHERLGLAKLTNGS